MTLLKNDKTLSEKVYKVDILDDLTIRDGWQFGIGFGLAMTIAIPVILLLISCLIGIGIMTLGGSLFSLIGG